MGEGRKSEGTGDLQAQGGSWTFFQLLPDSLLGMLTWPQTPDLATSPWSLDSNPIRALGDCD